VLQLEPGDKLILYTDGVNETLNAGREQFGLERLVQLILEHGHLPVKDLLDLILSRVKEFADEQGIADDITIMVLQIMA
jgi:sigma-B regulation protein RsbU (phosphoserine phosphatase)